MFGKGNDIYRSKALDRLSSPEAVDQLLHVVSPRDWLPLIAAGLLLAVVVTWSLVGTIPTTVNAPGVLVRPRTVVRSQNLSAGRLEALQIKPGDYVNKGDVIGRIDQSDVRERLQEDRTMLAQLRQQDRLTGSLQERETTLQKQENETERKYIELQTETLRKSLQDIEALRPMLRRRLDGLQTLRKEGLISEVSLDLLQAEQAVLDNDTKTTDITARLKQLDGQLQQAETREAGSARENVESSSSRRNQMQDLQARISLAELQLARSGEIRSEYSGRIIEVTATAGQILSSGASLAAIDVDDASQPLVSISYFPVGDGKKVQPGMTIQVTPDSVERQQFGGVIGVVESVADLPVTREAALLVIGNPSIVELLVPNSPVIQVTSRLEADPSTFSGYKWSSSSGPGVKMSGGLTTTGRVTVERRTPIAYIFPFLRSISGIY